MREQFLLDPSVIFLNHGSFGATPKPVFEVYQNWQLEMERQPVAFLGRQVVGYLADARAALANFIGCEAEDVVQFPNPTTALNMVIKSLRLQPGDEILTSNHEYGALDRTWRWLCRQQGAIYVQREMPLPMTTPAAFVEHFWAGVTPRTKVIFLSHLTSPTALIFPIAEICRRARAAGILTIIDGAHVPGQLPLNLRALDCDVYAGALHKWLGAPKGAAFVYVRPEIQLLLQPLVVSWGWESDPGWPLISPFIDHNEWQGTRDMAANLSVPAAIHFWRTEIAPRQVDCRALARYARAEIEALTGLPSLCPADAVWLGQMMSVRLPASCDVSALKTHLYDDYRIEVPVMMWQGQPLMRVSVQVYNTATEIDTLVQALGVLLMREVKPT